VRVFQVNNHQVNRKDGLPALFNRAVQVATTVNPHGFRRYFYFADSGHGTSAVARAVKNFPQLEKFCYFVPEIPNSRAGHHVLSNLTDVWAEANPNGVFDDIDTSTLAGVAEKIPKPLHFMYGTFVFDQLDWFGTGNAPSSPAILNFKPSPFHYGTYLSPSIHFQSNWGMSARNINLFSVLELDLPKNAEEKLHTPDTRLKEIINSLGKVRQTSFVAAPSPEEKAAVESLAGMANEIIAGYERDLDLWLAKVPLTNVLPNVSICGTMDHVSPKEHIVNTFKLRHYKYFNNQSGLGVYVLGKKTRNNNHIELMFDFAPMVRALSWVFVIQGPLWKHCIHPPFYHGTPRQYGITDSEMLSKVIANAGDIAGHLEQTLVPAIEKIYGPAPSWYEYQT